MCGGFKEANDKCEPMKTTRLDGPVRGNERRTANKADGIKTSKEKVKNRGTQEERDSLFMKGRKIDRQRNTPAQKLLNLTMAHRSLSRQVPVDLEEFKACVADTPGASRTISSRPVAPDSLRPDRGYDWAKTRIAGWSAFNAGTWIRLLPHWEDTQET